MRHLHEHLQAFGAFSHDMSANGGDVLAPLLNRVNGRLRDKVRLQPVTNTAVAKAEPVKCWQSVQWHTPMKTSSVSAL